MMDLRENIRQGERKLHKMVDKEYIRKLYYLEGWSIRKISRQLPVSRPTIRKMLVDEEIPRYNLEKQRPSPVMDKYRPIIKQWLKEDELAPPKQRHTATRIFERLQEEYGFTGASSTVRRVVAQLKQSVSEVFIPLTAAPGEQIQVDFGHAQVNLAGVNTKACLFCMRFKYSKVPYVVAFPTERLEAFLEGHVLGFSYFGGVPRGGLYDNAKTQVVKILEGPNREEHERFASLRAHYLFDSHFCRPRHGNEKGAVENLVKYVRSHVLVPVPSYESWEELNASLLKWCEKEKDKHRNEWEEEKRALMPLPPRAFCTARPLAVKASRYSLVVADRNRYSVPTEYVGQNLLAKIYVNKIEILNRSQIIATHIRYYGRGHTSLQLEHYLTALERKPHAITHATVVRQLPQPFQKVRERMEQSHSTGYKDFLKILLLTHEYSLEEISQAITVIGPYQTNDVSLRQYLNGKRRPSLNIPTKPLITVTDTQHYDQLLQGVRL
jgi:transposase